MLTTHSLPALRLPGYTTAVTGGGQGRSLTPNTRIHFGFLDPLDMSTLHSRGDRQAICSPTTSVQQSSGLCAPTGQRCGNLHAQPTDVGPKRPRMLLQIDRLSGHLPLQGFCALRRPESWVQNAAYTTFCASLRLYEQATPSQAHSHVEKSIAIAIAIGFQHLA